MARPSDGRYGYFYARTECRKCGTRYEILRRLYERYKRTQTDSTCPCGGGIDILPIGWKAYSEAMLSGQPKYYGRER